MGVGSSRFMADHTFTFYINIQILIFHDYLGHNMLLYMGIVSHTA